MSDRPEAAPQPPEIFRFGEDGEIPNNPELPVLIYRGVAEEGERLATRLETLFRDNGWTNSWRNGLYDYHHFHSNAHEVLGIARGSVRARIGGPSGESVELSAGDVIVLPAGTGHKCEKADDDLLIVGAYDRGRDWDLRTGEPNERAEVRVNIRDVPRPEKDPVTGSLLTG